MEELNHAKRAHALLSASGAKRWLNCTPSAKLEELYGEESTSKYAAEGTLAHELAELYLRYDLLEAISEDKFNEELERIMNNELYDSEMPDKVAIYTDYCAAQVKSAIDNSPLSHLVIEQKLDLTEYVPDSFGTADFVLVNDGVLEVADLKYGKGVPVSAEWNYQLMLYGLGTLAIYDSFYDIHTLKLTIVQPRLDNISSWEVSVAELKEWAETELKPKAKMAFNGEGELNAGDWCRFCKVRNRCRKLYEEQCDMARYDFQAPEILTDEEIADVIAKGPLVIEWLNAVTEYAQNKAVEGKQWPGFKLVEGVSRRKWRDEDEVANTIFAKCPDITEDEIFSTKLNSITAIEKVLGKKRFNEVLAGVVIKPEGKPTLVPISDKRPAMGIEQAKLDFSK